jgi:hypothetical protein
LHQQQVRRFVERYLATFSAHIVESHSDYLTVKLPVEVDKDIGNRPFYWSWVEKMNLAYQPLVLTFAFHPDRMPDGLRAEHLHLGAGRMQQIFDSTKKHGRFLCMYEQNHGSMNSLGHNRSTPLVPWLGLNMKVSLLCDKRRDILLYLGINMHNPRVVHDFTSFLFRLSLSPAIPDYFYTLDRRITVSQALEMAEQEITNVLDQEDHQWAEEARARLTEELAILEAYYAELAMREHQKAETESEEDDSATGEMTDGAIAEEDQSVSVEEPVNEAAPPLVEASLSFDEYRTTGGRILDFLRANGIQTTPREKIDQQEWIKSTPDEERQRRMDELAWQYEPRIEVKFINGGLFYLHSSPPPSPSFPPNAVSKNPVSGRIM